MTTEILINPDRFQTFFNGLETRKTLLTKITDLHKNLTNHFTSLNESLSQKSQTLDTQLETFKAQTQKTLESLENRENAIPETESNLTARVEEIKNSAIGDIGKNLDGGERDLRMYFRRMDSVGLMRFLLAKRKESAVMRAEMAAAVEEAVDLLGFVVEAVENFVEMKAEGKVGMADRRWACGILIQGALPVGPPGGSGVRVSSSLKERAGAILEKWKGMLGGGEGSSGVGAGEATMFLQMVIGFGLKDKFEEQFLRKLVVEFATRRDMAKLAVALGFEEKMGVIIDELVKSGKEIEAVYFASESGLTDRFPPVNLLRSCLRNCKAATHHNSSATEEAYNLELNTTKAIIKCVEDHKLESEFTLDGLKKRVTHLEKGKADKKKSAISMSKPSNKRPHEGGGAPSFVRHKGRTSQGARQRKAKQLSATRYSASYNYSTPSVYESPTTASYGPGYGGAHSQSIGLPPHQYAYAPQDVGASGVRAGGSYGGQAAYGGQSTYGAYDYRAAAAAAATPTYPATYQL